MWSSSSSDKFFRRARVFVEEEDVEFRTVSQIVRVRSSLGLFDLSTKMPACNLSVAAVPVCSSSGSNHVVAAATTTPQRAAASISAPAACSQLLLTKSGIPMLASESTKRLTVLVKKSRRGVQQPDVMGSQKHMRSLAVRASSSSRIETVIKGLQNLLHLSENADTTDYVSVEGVLTVRKRSVLNWMDINSDIVDDAEDALLDRKVLLQLVSSDQVDPGTKIGKLGKECEVLNWNLVQDSLISEDVTYPVTLLVPKDFGTPGAFIVRNKHMNEFFLKSLSLTLPDNSSGNKTQVFFPCNSWVYNEKKYQCNRIFFSNQAFLTDQTPPGLVQLRETEMMNLRGDGLGERQVWDRIYDYAIYNDLGDPTKPEDRRPNLGGSKEFPYPRRCRTGRPVYDVGKKKKKLQLPPHPTAQIIQLLLFFSRSSSSILHCVQHFLFFFLCVLA